MKNKKIWLSIFGILVSGILFLLFINFYTFNKVGEKLAIKKGAIKHPEKYEIYKTIKCDNFYFWNPEYAFVNKWKSRDNYEIMFYKVKPKTYFSQDYNFEYIGGTDIKNTTFENLLSMVKQDCEQFKTGSKEIKEKGIIWSYSKYDKEKEEKRKKEKEEEKRKSEEYWNSLSEEEKEKIQKQNEEFKKEQERWNKMSQEEKVKFLEERFNH